MDFTRGIEVKQAIGIGNPDRLAFIKAFNSDQYTDLAALPINHIIDGVGIGLITIDEIKIFLDKFVEKFDTNSNYHKTRWVLDEFFNTFNVSISVEKRIPKIKIKFQLAENKFISYRMWKEGDEYYVRGIGTYYSPNFDSNRPLFRCPVNQSFFAGIPPITIMFRDMDRIVKDLMSYNR